MKIINKPFVIAGPCAAESLDLCTEISKTLRSICKSNGVEYVFKASFDKANRTSVDSYRGPGLQEGKRIFKEVKKHTEYICTDIHEPSQAKEISDYVDIIQIPAFLCRQTDLLVAAGETGKTVNIKKAQFLAHSKMKFAVDKVLSTGNKNIILTERGSMFGLNDMIVDFRGIKEMSNLGYPVVIDATHSCQTIGSGPTTSGKREYAPLYAKAGLIFGATGVFMEVHPEPEKGLSDSANMIDYETFEDIIKWMKFHYENKEADPNQQSRQ